MTAGVSTVAEVNEGPESVVHAVLTLLTWTQRVSLRLKMNISVSM